VKSKLKTAALQGLRACDGVPMPASALVAHLQNSARPKGASLIECEIVLKELEAERWIAGLHDDLTNEISYTLTEKGAHKAAQL